MYSKEARITLFSIDADIENSGYENRPRTFNWNISKNLGTFSDDCKIAVESIFCRNMRAIIKGSNSGVLSIERSFAGASTNASNYKNNDTLTTQAATGTGTGLTIKNIQHPGTKYNILGKNSKVILRGNGYQVGDVIDVLDSDRNLPTGAALAKIKVMSVCDNDDNHDFIVSDVDFSSNVQIQRMLGVGNQDEKEIYSIRCPHVNGNYDSRAFNGGDIIYMGPMKMTNTNPEQSFCYDLKDKSFLNGGIFTLTVDSNYGNEKGISHDMIWGITLKEYDSYK